MTRMASRRIRYFTCLVLTAFLVLYSAGTPFKLNAATQEPSTRDPAYFPFDTNSPWNMPIGSDAKFEPVKSPNWTTKALKYGLLINSTDGSIPVYVATSSDPVRNIYRTDGNIAFQMRVPDAATPARGVDAHLSLIDETHTYVIEMLNANRRNDGDIEAPFPNKIDLRGPGISKDYEGSCAYGGSCTAGLIRKGELTNGIRHALSITIDPAALNKNAPGKPYVWPANAADDGDGRTYTDTGNVYMGSLLAIPPNVNIQEIAGPPGTPLYELAKALQDYGVYVIDRGNFNIYAEPTADAEQIETLRYNTTIPKYLQVVVNNGPNSIGGGGVRSRSLAPPFAPQFTSTPEVK